GRPEPGAPPAAAAPAIQFPGARGRQALGEGLDGLPIVKPPYGVIAAIDLNQNGKLLFQVPHGDTPDNVRNHPLLSGMNIPKTGQGNSVGIMVTKTVVVAGDPQITQPPGRARGAMLRAYDKKNEIGRASCRERADKAVGAGTLKDTECVLQAQR